MRILLTIETQTPVRRRDGDLFVDLVRREVRRWGVIVHFKQAPQMFKALVILAANAGCEVTVWEIFYFIYHEENEGGPVCDKEAVVQKMHRLREKLLPLRVTVGSRRKGYGYTMYEVEENGEANEQRAAGLGDGAPAEVSGDTADGHKRV